MPPSSGRLRKISLDKNSWGFVTNATMVSGKSTKFLAIDPRLAIAPVTPSTAPATAPVPAASPLIRPDIPPVITEDRIIFTPISTKSLTLKPSGSFVCLYSPKDTSSYWP